jgi:hypothetical protein
VPCPSCSSPYLDPYGRCGQCGYVGAPPAVMYQPMMGQPPKAPTGLAIAAQALLGAQILGCVAGIVGDIVGLISLHANGDVGSVSSVFSGFGTFLILPTFLALVVVVIIWFHKARSNADILAPHLPKRYSRGWAIAGWLTPVAWFWIPRSIARDIWFASRPLASGETPPPQSKTTLLESWWASWCLFWAISVVGGIVNPITGSSLTVSQLESRGSVSIAENLARAASAVLLILLVRRITGMQQIRILQGPGEGHPYSLAAQQQYAPAPYGQLPAQYPYPYPAPYPAPQQAYQPAAPFGQPYPAPQQTPAAPVAPVDAAVDLAKPTEPTAPAESAEPAGSPKVEPVDGTGGATA